MKMNQKGFSLVELMIVVAIIGILATIAIPQYQKFQIRAKQSEARTALSGVYTAMKAFQAEWGAYHNDLRVIGLQPEGDIIYNFGFTTATPGIISHPNATARAAAAQIAANQRCLGATGTPTAAMPCRYIGGQGGNAAGRPALPASTANATVFNAGAATHFGKTQADQWRITQLKIMTHLVDGSM